jgi:HPt (histidine-containing phosphotransfer) domain-containing protein
MSFPTMLLVSGNDAVRREMQSLLQLNGNGPLSLADSLSAAVQVTIQTPPDIVLLDARMPDLDLKRILLSAGGKRPPVLLLLLEGPCSAAQERAWRDEGAAGFLAAPFDPRTFAPRVQELAEQAWFSRKLADLAELGGPSFVSEMIGAFLSLGTTAVAEIAAGLASGDLPAVARSAHSLKSAAANLGAEEMHELAMEIESQARSGATGEMLPLESQKLATAFDRARVFLQRHRSG